MAKWNVGKVIERIARKVQAAAIRAVRSSSPAPHRPTRDATRKSFRAASLPGGSLVAAISKRDFITVKPWGVVLNWAPLGPKFMWLVNGTPRQKARPVKLAPDVAEIVREVREDGVRHFTSTQARAR